MEGKMGRKAELDFRNGGLGIYIDQIGSTGGGVGPSRCVLSGKLLKPDGVIFLPKK